MLVEEPIVSYVQLDLNRQYSYVDYLKWKIDERIELIKGWIMKMSSPSSNHQIVVSKLYKILDKYFEKSNCTLFFAPYDVKLEIPKAIKDHTVVQPDLLVVCDSTKIKPNFCEGSPDLIVEILSTNSKHDLKTKFDLYEEAEVQEYWIVDTDRQTIIVYYLQNEKYIGSKPFLDEDIVESKLFPELKVEVNLVFEGMINY
jgi:Uma2 family endonuclease